jgi:lysine 2,3-aminomutase
MTKRNTSRIPNKDELFQLAGAEAVARKNPGRWPTLLNEYFSRRIRGRDRSDPLRKQVIPAADEMAIKGIRDFCGEIKYLATDYLIHRYSDRAVLLAGNRCFCNCRFCFRKERLAKAKTIDNGSIDQAVKYIKKHAAIRELIISGGDPLTLPNEKLKVLFSNFGSLDQLKLIRVASRALTFFPARLDRGLIRLIKNSKKQIWFVSHFNHPAELGRESLSAIRKLRLAGIPVINQTVLLKGINDNADVLADLFCRLAGSGVKPYYLFQCDPAPGARHFSTDLEKSLEIYEQLCLRSGLIVPRFAFELPGYGKVSPGPGWKIVKDRNGYRVSSPWKKEYFYPS